MTPEEAVRMIAARPETRLGDAAAWAAYEDALAMQEGGATPEEVTARLVVYVEAERLMLADALDLRAL